MGRPDMVTFQGVVYRRMGGARSYYLSQSTRNAERKKAKGLHVAIWECVHGAKVPTGKLVHHVDGNPFNNSPDNLCCLSVREHRQHHGGCWEKNGRTHKEHLDSIRHLAAQWHSSEEGHAWHREHGRKSFEKRQRMGFCCEMCGTPFESVHKNARFCCHNCDVKWRARNVRVLATRICIICGVTFTVSEPKQGTSAKRRTCGRACKNRLLGRQKAGIKPRLEERVCTTCGVRFRPNSGAQRYCAKACTAKGQKQGRV